jgi:hypothetical protein
MVEGLLPSRGLNHRKVLMPQGLADRHKTSSPAIVQAGEQICNKNVSDMEPDRRFLARRLGELLD